MTITLAEEFNSLQGLFPNYDAYAPAERDAVRNLRHADIRVMQQTDIGTSNTVFMLSQRSMSSLQGQTMTQVQTSTTATRKGEAWSAGTVAVDPTRGNFRVLSLTIAAGTTTTSSVVTDVPVDISTGFVDTDSVSVALPTFPAGFVTQSTSFIDFTSHPSGDFAVGPTASVALSASTVSLIAGDSEFRVPRSAFNQNGINLGAITGVRFRIVGTGASTVRVMGVRILASTWAYGQVDTDTRYGRLRRGLPRNGDLTVAPFNFPAVFRSTDPPGYDDPRPIDAEYGVVFNTGSQSGTNSFSLYFRELTEDFMTQLDLNSEPQSAFNGRIQPDVGAARYGSRTQYDLDALVGIPGSWTVSGIPHTQTDLETEKQFSLERVPDSLSASYTQFTVQWAGSTGTVSILNSEGGGYGFTITGGLTANTNYVAFARMEDNAVQLVIYPLDIAGNVLTGQKVFDSARINDDFAYKRRAGRFGWRAQFADGDAFIDSIRPRGATYAEYRSLPYESFTPVQGAELFATHTPHQELLQAPTPGPYNDVTTKISRDTAQSTSGESWRIDTFGKRPLQGFSTNLFQLSDFQNTVISFDLLYPAFTLAAGGQLLAYLTDRNAARVIPLVMPKIRPDQWQPITLRMPFDFDVLAGEYRLLLLQASAGATTWWIDKPHIYERGLVWDARGVVDDPWGTQPANWFPFFDNYNVENGGVMFDRRGTHLQVRGRARRQDARIDRIQFRPKYAQLGRLVWASDQPAPAINPTANFTSAVIGTRKLRFTSTATATTGNQIVNNEWNFGDGGVSVGAVVEHTFAATGAYNVTLVATDNHGNQGIITTSIGV
jgi:hypothetical protein